MVLLIDDGVALHSFELRFVNFHNDVVVHVLHLIHSRIIKVFLSQHSYDSQDKDDLLN